MQTKDFQVGDYISDYEKLYRIYDKKDAFFFYKPVKPDRQLDTVVCSIPVSSIQKSGFRHLISVTDLQQLYAEMARKFTPIPLDLKSIKETVYLNDPFKTIKILKSFFQSQKSLPVSTPKINQELMESIKHSLVAEISFVSDKPEEVVSGEITKLISLSLS